MSVDVKKAIEDAEKNLDVKLTGAYFNVSSKAIIDVPRGCCFEMSVENNSETAEPINVRNANLIVTRIA